MKRAAIALLSATAISGCATSPQPANIDALTVSGRTEVGEELIVKQQTLGTRMYGVEMHTYQWPGVYIEGRFKGESVTVNLNDSANILNIIIDDRALVILNRPGLVSHRIDGLGNDEHTIRLEKRTETQSTTGTFLGFSLPEGSKPLPAPAPRARQIEFIGDSDMVGFGNLSAKRECSKDEIFDTTDSQQAYPAQVARKYNADFQLNAYSGIGIVRNYDGHEPERPMPVLYPRVLFDDPTPYDRKGWAPQVIVIALGGNDFSTPLKPGEKWQDTAALRADWEATFVKFLADIRAQNPDAYLIMGVLETFNADYLAASKSVLAAYRAGGDARIGMVTYPQLENTGCLWHPSLNDHKTMTDIVARFIDQQPDIWQGK